MSKITSSYVNVISYIVILYSMSPTFIHSQTFNALKWSIYAPAVLGDQILWPVQGQGHYQ